MHETASRHPVNLVESLPSNFCTGYARDLEVAREIIRSRRHGGNATAPQPKLADANEAAEVRYG